MFSEKVRLDQDSILEVDRPMDNHHSGSDEMMDSEQTNKSQKDQIPYRYYADSNLQNKF